VQKSLVSGLVGVALLASLAPVPSTSGAKSQEGEPSRPNVLVIVTDDQRFDTMRVMPKSRRLLARRGIRFTSAVATTPQCCPSRASIFSGRYAHNHRVLNNLAAHRLDHDKTVQKVLSDNGYLTALVGKYLNHWQKTLDEPLNFDSYVTFAGRSRYYDFDVLINGNRRRISSHSTRYFTRIARRFMTRFHTADPERPWLMFVAPFSPHTPAVATPKHRRAPVPRWRRPPSLNSSRFWFSEPVNVDRMRRARARHLRSLMDVDDMVAGLVGHLDNLGQLENTLIVYTSDHGYMWGEHSMISKSTPFDESVRVPLLVRWDAGGIPQSVRRRDVVANIDIAPTIYDVAGITPPYAVDGRSLLSDHRRSNGIFIEARDTVEDPIREHNVRRAIPRWLGLWTPAEAFFHFPQLEHNELYAPGDRYQLLNILEECHTDPCRQMAQPYLDQLDAWRQCGGQTCP
jgi:arylsulfatase A-like enzyme